MGTLGGFIAVALALASLSAPPESLTRAIALAQSTQILGFMVGPVLGAFSPITSAFARPSSVPVVWPSSPVSIGFWCTMNPERPHHSGKHD
jgi:MFS family permease